MNNKSIKGIIQHCKASKEQLESLNKNNNSKLEEYLQNNYLNELDIENIRRGWDACKKEILEILKNNENHFPKYPNGETMMNWYITNEVIEEIEKL